MKEPPFGPDGDPCSGLPVSILDSCVLFCDAVISGEGCAAALKYDVENMAAPMIVLSEKGVSAEALVRAAGALGVPVIKNAALAQSLVSSGKAGGTIPESLYQGVSLALARLGPVKPARLPRPARKACRVLPVKVCRPFAVEMGGSLFALTGEEPGRDTLVAEPLNAVRKKATRLLGFAVPPVRVSRNPGLKPGGYRVLFRGLEAGRGNFDLGWYAHGSGIPRSFFPDIMAGPGNIRAAAKAVSAALVRQVSAVFQNRAPDLLGRDEVQAILDAAEEKYPVVTGEVKSLLSLGVVRDIFQSLVSEQVSIRHIAVILETLADWGSLGPAPGELIVDQIRQSLKRQICLEYTDDRLTLRVLTLGPELDQGFADHSPASGGGGAVSPVDGWTELISSAVRGMEAEGFPPVILCSPKARFPVKEATRKSLPDLAVLSYLEIPTDISVEPVGEIRP